MSVQSSQVVAVLPDGERMRVQWAEILGPDNRLYTIENLAAEGIFVTEPTREQLATNYLKHNGAVDFASRYPSEGLVKAHR